MELFKYKYDDLFNPVINSLKQLGGSGTNSEIEEKLIEVLNLTTDEIEDVHRGNTTKLSYRCGWAKNYLKRFGMIENSARAVWSLTKNGMEVNFVDKEEVKRTVKQPQSISDNSSDTIIENETLGWEEELLNTVKSIEPPAFERLSKRLLRELGFDKVEVTGKSGDGGIDGIGIIKIGGVISFQVVFQCKKYQGTVSSSAIRDFRGAMIGRADKGIFITTGIFSRDAKSEAKRDGAPPIDLVDGIELVNKLKELNLGVSVEVIEKININKDWFNAI